MVLSVCNRAQESQEEPPFRAIQTGLEAVWAMVAAAEYGGDDLERSSCERTRLRTSVLFWQNSEHISPALRRLKQEIGLLIQGQPELHTEAVSQSPVLTCHVRRWR